MEEHLLVKLFGFIGVLCICKIAIGSIEVAHSWSIVFVQHVHCGQNSMKGGQWLVVSKFFLYNLLLQQGTS